jgi:hypothetical protein
MKKPPMLTPLRTRRATAESERALLTSRRTKLVHSDSQFSSLRRTALSSVGRKVRRANGRRSAQAIPLVTYDSDDDDYNHKIKEWFGLVDLTNESVCTICPSQDLEAVEMADKRVRKDVSDISSGHEVFEWECSTNDAPVGSSLGACLDGVLDWFDGSERWTCYLFLSQAPFSAPRGWQGSTGLPPRGTSHAVVESAIWHSPWACISCDHSQC